MCVGATYRMRKKIYKMYHDAAAGVNKKLGLERGDNINLTGARNRTSEKYWQWLRESCNKLENKMVENMESLDYLNSEIIPAQPRVIGLSKMVENLRTNRGDILAEIEMLREAKTTQDFHLQGYAVDMENFPYSRCIFFVVSTSL